MQKEPKFDVVYHKDYVTINYHFCRELDENGDGCHGTNPDHGYTLEQAIEIVAIWHENQAKLWRYHYHWAIPEEYRKGVPRKKEAINK